MEEKRKCNALDRLLDVAEVITDIASTDQETRDGVRFGLNIAKGAAYATGRFPKEQKPLVNNDELCNMARKYNLIRVVLFPCVVKGVVTPCFKMYGGNIDGFCQAIGIIRIPLSIVDFTHKQVEALEQNCGIVLYEHNRSVLEIK